MPATESNTTLKRVLTLPLLVFYGVGVTVGAGIFALIGEIVRIAQDGAPAAFLLAGLIAGVTGVSYGFLSAQYPRAAGEAVYVRLALGKFLSVLVGYGVTITAIVSSAVIALSFGGYLGTIIPVPNAALVIGILAVLAFIASWGVRESVLFAAAITVLEVGTLVIIVLFSAPLLVDTELYGKAISPVTHTAHWPVILSASVIAFFAFVGFEDLVNMAEEAIDPKRTMPRAVIITLLITITLYAVIALVAIAMPDRDALTTSNAPLATLFNATTGLPATPISAIASIAMVNGILVQILMASRVLYGMSCDGLAPVAIGVLNPTRRTPVRAVMLVTLLIAALALGLEQLTLAQLTSLITLGVFMLVNLALFLLGKRNVQPTLHKWRYWGLGGAVLCAALLVSEGVRISTEFG